MRSRVPYTLAITALVAIAAPLMAVPANADTVPVVKPVILANLPHDPSAYSEGLEFDGPALYETTGEYGMSQIRQVDPATGAVLRSADLPKSYFGEGLAILGDRIWQLTYDSGVAIEWDKATFAVRREVPVPGQAWGLCLDGGRLVRSDGTDRLYFHDVDSFAEQGSVAVTRNGTPLFGLDELECVDGQVWAAAWPGDEFVRIDPSTGVVNLTLDTSNLWQWGPRKPRQVVSSIAHIAGNEYLISGKEWPDNVKVRIDG